MTRPVSPERGQLFLALASAGVSFEALKRKGVDFSWADFRFQQIYVDQDLSYLNLAFADLTGASMEGARFPGANLRGAVLDRVWMHTGSIAGAILDFASFRKAFLADVDFSGARLTRAVFDGALLRGARFEQANLADAALDGAILDAAVSADAAWMEHIERLIRGAWQVTAEPNRGMSDRYSDDETLLVIRPNL